MRYEWKPEYSLDNPTIDNQHRQLLELGNLVLQACEAGRDERVVWNAFKALHQYVSRHFDDEETLFAETGSTRLDEHRTQHEILTRELKQLWTASRMNLLQDVLASLASWLSQRLIPHMVEEDGETWRAAQADADDRTEAPADRSAA